MELTVSVPHDVLLALLAVLSCRLDCVLVAQLLQIVELHNLGADETPLKVAVNLKAE